MASFSLDNNAIVFPVVIVVLEQRANVIDIDLLFGDEHNVRATGNAGGIGDPAGIAPHHFADNNTVVRVGSGVQAVDGFSGDHNRGVKAEGLVCAADIVVDRLRHANSVDAVLGKKERDGLSVIAAESNESGDLVQLEDFLHLLN